MSTFFRILSLVLIFTVLCCVIALPASAYEIWNVYDNISDIVLDGDIATLTVKLPVDDCEWAFNVNGNISYYNGQNVHHYVTAGQSFNLYFNPFGPVHSQTPKQGVFFRDHMLSFEDLPEDATFSQSLNIGVSNGADVSWHSVRSSIYYASNKNEYLYMTDFGRTVEWDSEVFVLRIRSDNVPIDTSEGAGFHTQMFVASLVLPYTGSTNFAYQFSISFNLSKAYFDYVSSGRYSQMLDAIESQLYLNGRTLGEIVNQQTQTNQTLEQIVDQQQQIHESLDDIINSEVTGEAPDGSDSVTDYESAEQELMDQVSGGNSQFDDITVSASDRIHLYSQAFLAFGYIFNLFADIPFLQGLLYVSLTLGSFAFLLGIGSAAARYFNYHHTAAGKRRGG